MVGTPPDVGAFQETLSAPGTGEGVDASATDTTEVGASGLVPGTMPSSTSQADAPSALSERRRT